MGYKPNKLYMFLAVGRSLRHLMCGGTRCPLVSHVSLCVVKLEQIEVFFRSILELVLLKTINVWPIEKQKCVKKTSASKNRLQFSSFNFSLICRVVISQF